MKKWPKQHIRLFSASLFLCFTFIFVYFMIVMPLSKKVSEDLIFIQKTTTDLHKSGWVLDPGRLAGTLQMKKNELDGVSSKDSQAGIRAKSIAALRYCTAPLNNKVKKLFDNPADFTRDVGRLDYQEEYNQVESKLASRGIFLSDKILKLGERSAAKDIYLLLLQVWMLEQIVSLATDSGLMIQSDTSVMAQDENGRNRHAAKIQFQHVVEYRLYESDQSPYLIELPMKIAFFGDSAKLTRFLSKLQSDGNFFAVGRFQIFSIPELRRSETELNLLSGSLSIEMECSAFFSPKNISDAKKPTPVQLIPPGA